MKISIIGYGKMGCEIEKAAREQNVVVASIIDPHVSAGGIFHTAINEESLEKADVAIDFTSPHSAIGNIRSVCLLGKSLVVGTTGWYSQLPEAKSIAQSSGTGLLYSPNFSLGVNLFLRIVRFSANAFSNLAEYDPFVYELHHAAKADSPSGTASRISEIILSEIKRKDSFATARLAGAIKGNELSVASIRAGSIPGTHVAGFDSPADTIELRHTARGRHGFAAGALLAAQWLNGKKGFFAMDDFLDSYLGRRTT